MLKLLFNTVHQPRQIEIYNASILEEIELEFTFSDKCKKNSNREKLLNSHFKKFYNLQVTKGRGAIANYEFFIKQLIEGDLPCLFFIPETVSPLEKEIEGIAIKFSSLETNKDILEFSKEYGLLGVLSPFSTTNNYGFTVFEPIYWWKHHISQIKNLFKLYKMLKKKQKSQNVDIIGELLNYKETNGVGTFEWNEGGEIPFSLNEEKLNDDELECLDEIAGVHILTLLIKEGLKGAINVDFSDIVRCKDSEIGFRIKEVYSTNYLLGAIYYDLWQLIGSNTEILFCKYCGRTFTKSGRKKYCNDSCKSMAYKQRKKGEK
ncbi:hypothetical protein [Priestia megaterium]|uniref:hypothetical protein n=1 Tax=Priestia megaterium TaxID=1404 RepID=UPI0011BB3E40|nr:hypothetical protein [Priestia megaterium]QDZ80167.1 hypothetical protein D0440_12220 [Priestia megaterium]